MQEGQHLIQEKPELSPVVRKKLEEIRDCWHDLESTTQAKARQLFEANKADLLVQSYDSLDQRLSQLEGQLVYVDQGQDLSTVNRQLKKLQVRDSSSQELHVTTVSHTFHGCFVVGFGSQPPTVTFHQRLSLSSPAASAAHGFL